MQLTRTRVAFGIPTQHEATAMADFHLFLLDCILVAMKAGIGVCLLVLSFVFAVALPAGVAVELGKLLRLLKRRRDAARFRFPD